MLAAMASTPASHSVKPPVDASFAPISRTSTYGNKNNAPLSPASPQSAQESPQSRIWSPGVSAKPQLAIKLTGSSPGPALGVRPLQQKAIAAGKLAVNVMSMNSVVSPMPSSPAAQSPTSSGKPPMSITSKEWVIPPRPKPGRKPATDTPPTKRKAQNRAAQRAFRERRAARVGELEDQLDEQKIEHDRAQQEYQDQIRSLETEVQVLRSRCQMLESLLEKEKAVPAWAGSSAIAEDRRGSSPSLSATPHSSNHQQQTHIHILSPIPQKRLHSQPRGSSSSSTSSASGRRASVQPFSISQITSPPEEADDLTCGSCNNNGSGSCACADEVIAATSAMGCGKCSIGTKCACLEESLQALSGEDCNNPETDLKRPHPPTSPSALAPDEKKFRHNSQSAGSTEIDFTNMFSQSKQITARTPLPSMPGQLVRQQPQHQVMRMEIPLKDKCGFCSDGTYCVCADTMPGVTMTGSLALTTGTVIAQQKTPPPSENDGAPSPMEVTATGAIKLSSMSSLRRQNKQAVTSQAGPLPPLSSCGPPSFERSGGEKAGGCCGGGGPGGCCKNKGADGVASGDVQDEKKPNSRISLSCADAYKTLSSHRHFDEATDEIGTWLPMLKAVPRNDSSAQPAERHPMEVEAASIMSVLKGFDVRFGK
ncbi:bzip transcription factor [Grosmannia clavigera kw1407]|uniref:Bzip transcription factor n=1 Tax=Grosmannia clavigera (strain kw1407 / UAMH 11150) TaxID=655863 RepID=F0XNW6_GROCL|nr:bzip transcription factor [Grosmannia clavigera kw1407]EFX00678.1 bzip transcription factor [Grosmannia clavigera kw1407]